MEEQTEVKPIEKVKKDRHLVKRTLLILAVLLLMAGSAGGAYWVRNNKATTFENKQSATIASLQRDKLSLQKQLSSQKAASLAPATATTTACTPKAPDAATIQNIEASVTSANTAALKGYMASSVQDVFAAADAIPATTPDGSVSDISTFVTDPVTGSWSFPVDAATVAAYKAGSYGKYFPSIAVVGSSTRHRVISFSFDCNAKISTVFMAADAALL
jgi:hypothetical protein